MMKNGALQEEVNIIHQMMEKNGDVMREMMEKNELMKMNDAVFQLQEEVKSMHQMTEKNEMRELVLGSVVLTVSCICILFGAYVRLRR